MHGCDAELTECMSPSASRVGFTGSDADHLLSATWQSFACLSPIVRRLISDVLKSIAVHNKPDLFATATCVGQAAPRRRRLRS
jgi:hypothetical protein